MSNQEPSIYDISFDTLEPSSVVVDSENVSVDHELSYNGNIASQLGGQALELTLVPTPIDSPEPAIDREAPNQTSDFTEAQIGIISIQESTSLPQDGKSAERKDLTMQASYIVDELIARLIGDTPHIMAMDDVKSIVHSLGMISSELYDEVKAQLSVHPSVKRLPGKRLKFGQGFVVGEHVERPKPRPSSTERDDSPLSPRELDKVLKKLRSTPEFQRTYDLANRRTPKPRHRRNSGKTIAPLSSNLNHSKRSAGQHHNSK